MEGLTESETSRDHVSQFILIQFIYVTIVRTILNLFLIGLNLNHIHWRVKMRKLYKVDNKKNTYYIIAEDLNSAEKLLTTKLDEADYGFSDDRDPCLFEILATELHEFPEGKLNFCGEENLLFAEEGWNGYKKFK